jgi:heat shock protein HslJ
MMMCHLNTQMKTCPFLSLKAHPKGTLLSRIISIALILLLSACSGPLPSKKLKSTYWALVELNKEDALNFEGQPDVHLIFHINDNSLHGSDGCNSIRADYIRQKETFTFKDIISTRMACDRGNKQAEAFILALKQTNRLQIRENEMILYHKGEQIARFEAKEDY